MMGLNLKGFICPVIVYSVTNFWFSGAGGEVGRSYWDEWRNTADGA